RKQNPDGDLTSCCWRKTVILRRCGEAQEPTLEQIQQSLVKAEKLVDLGYLNSAFISAWSAFEAAMRMAIRAAGETAGWGTTPRDLMNELVSSGIVSQ